MACPTHARVDEHLETLPHPMLVPGDAVRLTLASAGCYIVSTEVRERLALSERVYFVLACIAAVVLTADVFASVVIWRSDFYSSRQRALQLVLVWLVPVVGAACCMSFAAIHKRAIPRPARKFPDPDSFGLPGGEANGP
ncbi:MAG: hypothetical protein AAGC76_20265 [Luteibacter sp.]|uniref:hypothetical protein n=1 Tax=Luteibacter sp. TaxID=1886636 RepID=UPI0028093E4C|nr:hypothetical protein [Luteibacter sp.]MDQ7998185.1 hypothetical protein [Luteibacter sp.]